MTKQPAPRAARGGARNTVTLASGGTLTLALSVDLFALSENDRKFVFGLIDQVTGYGKRTARSNGRPEQADTPNEQPTEHPQFTGA
jgi:hypothetical protein